MHELNNNSNDGNAIKLAVHECFGITCTLYLREKDNNKIYSL